MVMLDCWKVKPTKPGVGAFDLPTIDEDDDSNPFDMDPVDPEDDETETLP